LGCIFVNLGMKKLLLLLFLPVLGYGQLSNAQKNTLKKMKISVVNRGLDKSSTFVPYSTLHSSRGLNEDTEASWELSLFNYGLDVGKYSISKTVKDTNNREISLKDNVNFDGRYVFEIKENGYISIFDLQNKNKIVATITYRGNIYNRLKDNFKRDYIISKLFRTNK
jgi:hypothetical protein